MLIDRLHQAVIKAGDLPEIIQQDIAELIEDLMAVHPVSLQNITIRDLIGDDGSDAFFDKMMDALDSIGHSVPPTPIIEDV